MTETETLGETRESEFRSPLANLPLRFGSIQLIQFHLLSTSARYVKGDQLFEYFCRSMPSAFMLFLASVVVALLAGPDPAIGAITSSLQSILKNTHGSADYGYPTDLTRDLLPVSLSVLSYINQLSVGLSSI